MRSSFKVGLTSDFLNTEGKTTFNDIGTQVLEDAQGLEWGFMDKHPLTIEPDHIRDYDAIVSLAPSYNRESFLGAEKTIVVSRFGVGVDMVDINACTEADILLCNTPGAVDNSMASSIVTWMLALSHRIFLKDKLVRDSRWGEKVSFMGSELRDCTLGIIGLGGIGTRLVGMLSGFEMKRFIGYDPYVSKEKAESLGVEMVSLDELLKQSDYVTVNCPLTDETRGLIGEAELATMKPSAYLINTARGGLVDENALIAALEDGTIAGAASDVFETEPTGGDTILAQSDKIILAPHCIGWTDELFRDIGHMACKSVVTVSRGEVPDTVVNPEVLERPGFQKKRQNFKTLKAGS